MWVDDKRLGRDGVQRYQRYSITTISSPTNITDDICHPNISSITHITALNTMRTPWSKRTDTQVEPLDTLDEPRDGIYVVPEKGMNKVGA
jgi:hypothetical protein